MQSYGMSKYARKLGYQGEVNPHDDPDPDPGCTRPEVHRSCGTSPKLEERRRAGLGCVEEDGGGARPEVGGGQTERGGAAAPGAVRLPAMATAAVRRPELAGSGEERGRRRRTRCGPRGPRAGSTALTRGRRPTLPRGDASVAAGGSGGLSGWIGHVRRGARRFLGLGGEETRDFWEMIYL